jgi:UDP-N-acetylmuramate-alanine ligase
MATSSQIKVILQNDFKHGPTAVVESLEAAREWFKLHPEFVPLKRTYLCEQQAHKVNFVCAYSEFAKEAITL